MIVIGIDPGKTGAVTVMKPSGVFTVNAMPDTPTDIYLLFKAIKLGHRDEKIVAYLERIYGTAASGGNAMVNFGKNSGHIEMALIVLKIKYEEVRSSDWQKELGCLTGGNKNVSKRKAQALFPGIHITHTTADSILIARYGQKKEKII